MRQKSVIIGSKTSSRYFNGAARQGKQKVLLDDDTDSKRNTLFSEDNESMFVQIPIYFNETVPVSSDDLISVHETNNSTSPLSDEEENNLKRVATKRYEDYDDLLDQKSTSTDTNNGHLPSDDKVNGKEVLPIPPKLLALSMLEEFLSSMITIVLLIILTLDITSNWGLLRKLQDDMNFVKYIAVSFIFGNLYTTNTLILTKQIISAYILNIILFIEELGVYSYLLNFFSGKEKVFLSEKDSFSSILGTSSSMLTSGLYSQLKIILILLIVTKMVSLILKSILFFLQIKSKSIEPLNLHMISFRITYCCSPLVILVNFMYGQIKDPFSIFSIFAILLGLLQVMLMRSAKLPSFLFNSFLIYLGFMNIQTVVRFGGEKCHILSGFNLALFLMSSLVLFFLNLKNDVLPIASNDNEDQEEKNMDEYSITTRQLIRDVKRLKIVNISICISLTVVINIINLIVEKIMEFESSWIILNIFNILVVPVLFIILELPTYKFSESRKIVGFTNKTSQASQLMILGIAFLEFLILNMYCLIVIGRVYNYMAMELVNSMLIFVYTCIITYVYRNFVVINQKMNLLKIDKNSELYYFDVETDPFDYLDPSSLRFSKLIRLLITPLLQIATLTSIISIILCVNYNNQEPTCTVSLLINFAILCSCHFMSNLYEKLNLDISGNTFKVNKLMIIHSFIFLVSLVMFILNIVIGSNIKKLALDIFDIESSLICFFLVFSDFFWGLILVSLGFIGYKIVWGYYKGNFNKTRRY